MYNKCHALFLSSLTPLHVGGGSEVSLIDLPIQREKHTSYPKIEASSLKGALRAAFDRWTDKKSDTDVLFGPEKGDSHAALLAFTDMRILFFPVKSAKGTFAWITCPLVLKRFLQDMKLVKALDRACLSMECFEIFENLKESMVSKKSAILLEDKQNGTFIFLDEYRINCLENEKLSSFLEKIVNCLPENEVVSYMFHNHAAVVSDELFQDFVSQSTEIITRIKINSETGTVKENALFTEEYVPTDSIFYGLAMETPLTGEQSKGAQPLENLKNFLENVEMIQLGGNSTLGKGIVGLKFFAEDSKAPVEGGDAE